MVCLRNICINTLHKGDDDDDDDNDNDNNNNNNNNTWAGEGVEVTCSQSRSHTKRLGQMPWCRPKRTEERGDRLIRNVATFLHVYTVSVPKRAAPFMASNLTRPTLTHWGRVKHICVFNTRLFSLHNILNYAIHRACLRMVRLTDVYRNLTSLSINL